MSDPQKPSIGRIVHFYPAGKYPVRQNGGAYYRPRECARPLMAFVVDTRAEVPELPDDMTVHLDVRGSAEFAPCFASAVSYSDTPTPSTHRWCWPPRV